MTESQIEYLYQRIEALQKRVSFLEQKIINNNLNNRQNEQREID
jgi:hypothetical protein